MSTARPNILLISTDEQRFDCMSCAGNPVLDTPHIAFISDHGDHLGDHRLLHKSGVTLYDACVRVPFLIRYPPLFPRGEVCDCLVESIDLAPTFLHAAGLEAPESMQGRSLVGLAEGQIDCWTAL